MPNATATKPVKKLASKAKRTPKGPKASPIGTSMRGVQNSMNRYSNVFSKQDPRTYNAGQRNQLKQAGIDPGADAKFREASAKGDVGAQRRNLGQLEAGQRMFERARIKKQFGEDIGGPGSQQRKPRNRAEAARKAWLTRKARGK